MVEAAIGVLGTAVLGVIGWAFQLNSRVAVIEANHENLKELIESRFDDVKARLARIEASVNGRK